MTHFGQKSSEWVKKVFFISSAVFFSTLWKWVSEWSLNFSRKKNRFQNFWEKIKNTYKYKYLCFTILDLFDRHLLFWRVSGLQTFPRKKKVFFFPKVGNNKKKPSKSSERVSDKLFQGNQKIRYLCLFGANLAIKK